MSLNLIVSSPATFFMMSVIVADLLIPDLLPALRFGLPVIWFPFDRLRASRFGLPVTRFPFDLFPASRFCCLMAFFLAALFSFKPQARHTPPSIEKGGR